MFFMSRPSGRRSIILVLCMIVAVVASLAVFTTISIEINIKDDELAALEARLEQLRQDNDEKEYLINNSGEAELYEHLARQRGYAYPDEHVYYDVTPGK